jgi:glycosyltransferase involved in cell wall biosynthesis
MAMCDALSEDLPYGDMVQVAIKQEDWSGYQEAIDFINTSSDIDLVCLQHEYGIYGGAAGEFAAKFVESLDKPVVATLHTILSEPTETQHHILQRICAKAEAVVVMLEQGAAVLSSTYQVPQSKIVTIPHGVPHFTVEGLPQWKKEKGLDNRVIMCGINLISPSKGIEYGIKSLPEIVKHIPNFLYLVVGATHPVILAKHQGRDEYREQLQSLSEELNVSQNVRFVNEYVSLDDLVKFVAVSDFYLTPYIDPQQVTSGALSYAIGAGKVCISTPYLYAREMLSKDHGILVPFRNHQAIAEAVVNLVKNPKEKKFIEQNALATGKSMNWEHVAEQYLQLFRSVLD